MTFLKRFLLFATLLCASGAQVQAGTVDFFSSPDGPYEIGDSFTLELKTSSDFASFGGYEGLLTFDTNAVELKSIAVDSSVFNFFDFVSGDADNQPILVSGASNPNIVGEQVLLTLTFKSLLSGTSKIAIDLTVAASATVDVFDGVVMAEIMTSGSDPILPIPLPAGLILLGSGLLALPLARRASRMS